MGDVFEEDSEEFDVAKGVDLREQILASGRGRWAQCSGDELTTSIHAHPSALYPPFTPLRRTRTVTAKMATTQAHQTPNTARLTRCLLPTSNPPYALEKLAVYDDAHDSTVRSKEKIIESHGCLGSVGVSVGILGFDGRRVEKRGGGDGVTDEAKDV